MFRLKTKILIVFFLFLIIFFAIAAYMTGIIKPMILDKCEAQLSINVQKMLNSAISNACDNEAFSKLINFSYSPDGRLSAYSADMLASTKIRTAIGESILSNASLEKSTLLKFNLGLLSGIPMLYALGPSLAVSIDGFTYSEIGVSSEFLDAGINQTLHKLYLDVRSVSKVKAPFFSEDIVTETKIPLSETILVGDVPDAYTVIIRAHEEDEEDLNDYAAEIEN